MTSRLPGCGVCLQQEGLIEIVITLKRDGKLHRSHTHVSMTTRTRAIYVRKHQQQYILCNRQTKVPSSTCSITFWDLCSVCFSFEIISFSPPTQEEVVHSELKIKCMGLYWLCSCQVGLRMLWLCFLLCLLSQASATGWTLLLRSVVWSLSGIYSCAFIRQTYGAGWFTYSDWYRNAHNPDAELFR